MELWSLCGGSGKKKIGIGDFSLFSFTTLSPLLLVGWDLEVEDDRWWLAGFSSGGLWWCDRFGSLKGCVRGMVVGLGVLCLLFLSICAPYFL